MHAIPDIIWWGARGVFAFAIWTLFGRRAALWRATLYNDIDAIHICCIYKCKIYAVYMLCMIYAIHAMIWRGARGVFAFAIWTLFGRSAALWRALRYVSVYNMYFMISLCPKHSKWLETYCLELICKIWAQNIPLIG